MDLGSGYKNSNLLGMGRTTSSCALLFLGWALPENFKRPSSQAKKIKILERFQAGGPAQYILTAIPNHRPSI